MIALLQRLQSRLRQLIDIFDDILDVFPDDTDEPIPYLPVEVA